jgi:membrane-associated phospholipid phosphatase
VAVTFTCAWNISRYLIHRESTIATLTPPYIVADGSVIVDMSLNQPLVDPPTIPSQFLVWTSVYLPVLLVCMVTYLLHFKEGYRTRSSTSPTSQTSTTRLNQWHKVSAALAGILDAISVSETSTQLLKLLIQQRRPNFYALCEFDATTKTCLTNPEQLRDANFSFPSVHSSLAACAMMYLACFALPKIIFVFIQSPLCRPRRPPFYDFECHYHESTTASLYKYT